MKKSVDAVLSELRMLSSLKNSFFVNLICAFQDRDCLYLVLDYFPGGDLRYNLTRLKKPMSEEMSSKEID